MIFSRGITEFYDHTKYEPICLLHALKTIWYIEGIVLFVINLVRKNTIHFVIDCSIGFYLYLQFDHGSGKQKMPK